LGLSQVAKVSEDAADSEALGRVLSKTGGEAGGAAPRLAKLLSKIGEALESDVRLKRDIEHLANRSDGLPNYAFKYLWDDEVHVGVMAGPAPQRSSGRRADRGDRLFRCRLRKSGPTCDSARRVAGKVQWLRRISAARPFAMVSQPAGFLYRATVGP